MTFYTYTIKKMMKSTSTYITGFISAALLWIVFLTSMTHLNDLYVYLAIPYFAMPLFSIFITFKAGQVFREEIENKTLLVIQSKPISRKNMILQGYLAVVTLMSVVAIVGTFIPVLIIFIMKGNTAYYSPFLVTLTQIILGALISIIALQLSLTFKGKAFIGIMIGAFGTGFYILFGLSAWLKFPNEFKALQYKEMSSKASNNGWVTLDSNSTHGGQSIDDLYKDLKSTSDFKTYDVVKWFDPSTHWGQMFGAGSPAEDNLMSNFISGRESTVSIQNVHRDGTTHKVTSFDVKGGNKESVPLWYSYMLWITIGAALIPLSIRSLSKRNIA